MVRSLENGPMRATLSAADRVQDGVSSYAAEARSWASMYLR